MKSLTTAEEQVMMALWKRKQAVVRDLLDDFPEPKPAYNTVSTIIRILEKKGFVDHKAYGKTHEYFPLVSESEYRKFSVKDVINRFFGNSTSGLLSYLIQEENISLEEMDQLMENLKEDNNGDA